MLLVNFRMFHEKRFEYIKLYVLFFVCIDVLIINAFLMWLTNEYFIWLIQTTR